jgi:hypothetical protein
MIQQINLYQNMFRKQKVIFPAAAVAVVILLGVITFVGAGLMLRANHQKQIQQVASMTKAKENMQLQVDELRAKLPSLQKDPALPVQIAALERERDQKRQAIAMLGDTKLGNTSGFSGLLEGLARRRVDSVWLEHFRFAAGGNDLSLVGSARAPELVPRLLSGLREEETFVGLRFDFLKMQRDNKDHALIHFYFGTQPKSGLMSGADATLAEAGGGASGASGELIDAVQQYWQQRVNGMPGLPSEAGQ